MQHAACHRAVIARRRISEARARDRLAARVGCTGDLRSRRERSAVRNRDSRRALDRQSGSRGSTAATGGALLRHRRNWLRSRIYVVDVTRPRGATALRPETRGTRQIVSAQFLVAAITWRLDGANHLGGPP
jgi:hypothetical protein